MSAYRNVTFDEIEVGATATVSRPVTHTEVEALTLVSGDVDPYHVEVGAPERSERAVSAQAVGAEAILSGLLNRRMPGPGTRIVAQDLEFRGKIRTGETVTATVVALEKQAIGNKVVFECRVVQSGIDLVKGTVTVEAPTRCLDDRRAPQHAALADARVAVKRDQARLPVLLAHRDRRSQFLADLHVPGELELLRNDPRTRTRQLALEQARDHRSDADRVDAEQRGRGVAGILDVKRLDVAGNEHQRLDLGLRQRPSGAGGRADLDLVERDVAVSAHDRSIQVVFSSVYLSNACSDLSRPVPDCLKPPNGTVMSSAS